MAMDGEILSTGQAARLCAVTPDTVLKWIKAGRLRARRTPGGHYRIQRQELLALQHGGNGEGATGSTGTDNVVVFTRRESFRVDRGSGSLSSLLRVEVVESVYQLSALVESFRPDYVVIDADVGSDRACEVTHQLQSDPRLHGVQVILATDRGMPAPACGAEVFTVIDTPITLEGIERCLKLSRKSNEDPENAGARP